MLRVLICLGAAVTSYAQVPAPRNLTAAHATNRQVDLTWSASEGAKGYLVERKTPGGRQFAPFTEAPVTEPRVADSSIDPFASYVYHVIAVNGANRSQPSNEITVGPPPAGFSTAVPTPAELTDRDNKLRFARYPQMVLDANGDPALCYYYLQGGDYEESTLHFVAWDRARYRWRDPVQVAKVGQISTSGPTIQFSLARDASNNTYGIAYQTKNYRAIEIAFSRDEGATWQTQTADLVEEGSAVDSPTLALGLGTAHIVWARSSDPLQYASGKETDPPSKWKRMPVPGIGAGSELYVSSLAVDADGKPGLAYLIGPESGYNTVAAFWRPGGNPVKVTDSANLQNDTAYLRLDFSGVKPRIALELGRTETRFDTGEWNYLVAATDNGSTWAAPVAIPSDGPHTMTRPALSTGPNDQVALLLEVSGGSPGDRCGYPKLSRSTDLRRFTTCSPDPKLRFSTVSTLQIKFAPNGKLYAAWANPDRDEGDPPQTGLIVWREP